MEMGAIVTVSASSGSWDDSLPRGRARSCGWMPYSRDKVRVRAACFRGSSVSRNPHNRGSMNRPPSLVCVSPFRTIKSASWFQRSQVQKVVSLLVQALSQGSFRNLDFWTELAVFSFERGHLA